MKMKKVEAKPPPGKLNTKAKKKGKGQFTDIIDELSYTLAKLRGEIVDDTPGKDTDGAIEETAVGAMADILAVTPLGSERRRSGESSSMKLLVPGALGNTAGMCLDFALPNLVVVVC